MDQLRKHVVYTNHGQQSLLDWVKDHKHRHFTDLKDVELLQKIAHIDDDEARHLLLDIFRKAGHLRDTIVEMHREFETLSGVLQKIADQEAVEPEEE